jgi:probable HAF family extracellular repeat protein
LSTDTYATGINAGGEIVGFYYNNGSGFPGLGAQGFLYNSGTYITLDDPLGVNGTFAYGINDLGEVVGFYYDATNTAHGFAYDGGTYVTLDGPLSGSTDVIAHGINDAGQIVGFYGGHAGDYFLGKGDHYSGFLATTPEPSTWAMMLLGFAGLGYASYLRTRGARAA